MQSHERSGKSTYPWLRNVPLRFARHCSTNATDSRVPSRFSRQLGFHHHIKCIAKMSYQPPPVPPPEYKPSSPKYGTADAHEPLLANGQAPYASGSHAPSNDWAAEGGSDDGIPDDFKVRRRVGVGAREWPGDEQQLIECKCRSA